MFGHNRFQLSPPNARRFDGRFYPGGSSTIVGRHEVPGSSEGVARCHPRHRLEAYAALTPSRGSGGCAELPQEAFRQIA
jgi:hypothetical protein